MARKPLIPKEVKLFSTAMLGIIVFIAIAAVIVDLNFGQ